MAFGQCHYGIIKAVTAYKCIFINNEYLLMRTTLSLTNYFKFCFGM